MGERVDMGKIWYVYTSKVLAYCSLYCIYNLRIKCYLYVSLSTCNLLLIVLITQQLMPSLIHAQNETSAIISQERDVAKHVSIILSVNRPVSHKA